MNLLPIILLLVASSAAIIAMFFLPLFGVYFFFFLLPLTFSLPWSIRRLRRHKKKNTMKCRGFSLAVQVLCKIIKVDFFLNKEKKRSVVATCQKVLSVEKTLYAHRHVILFYKKDILSLSWMQCNYLFTIFTIFIAGVKN